MADIPRIMFAAPNSDAGKTTITLAVLAALLRRSVSPVAFKCGPDYIDPMFHREVLGVPGYNLDLFFTDKETVCGLLREHAKGYDVAVIEGVMGYYDGIGSSTTASSYELAQATKTPVILVVPAYGASLSIAAVIKGFNAFRKQSRIMGVILNNCSEPLFKTLKTTLEEETGLPMLGFFPNLEACRIESRHLGLVTAAEISNIRGKIKKLGAQAEQSIDIDALLSIAASAPKLYGKLPQINTVADGEPRVAVAQDRAFCFYYHDNLALLERMGAKIVLFSPLNDKQLPEDASALYLGGGYPELYANVLSENASMLQSVYDAVKNGMPALAECGGFLYLQDTLEDNHGKSHKMVGLLNGHGYKTPELNRFGYLRLTARIDTVLCSAGETIAGHEFHYWDSTHTGGACTARNAEGRAWACVDASNMLFAGFPHIYFYNNPAFAARFVKAASVYKKQNHGKNQEHYHEKDESICKKD